MTRARGALGVYQSTRDFEHIQRSYIPARAEADGCFDRLVLRLGPDEVVAREYSQLLKSLALLRDAFDLTARRDYSKDAAARIDEESRRMLEDDLSSALAEAQTARDDFEHHWDTYVGSARSLVAARLEAA